MSWRDKPWILPVALVVATVLVGGLSFLLGGLTSKDAKPRASRLTPERLFSLKHAPTVLLSVPRGDGSGPTVNETLQYAFVSGDHTFLVDDDPKTWKTRVRWFDRAGKLSGVYLCPVRSTDFAPAFRGFSFVIAPGAKGKHEVAGVYSVEESKLTTYSIPGVLGSAGLVERGDILYTQVDSSSFDIRNNSVVIDGGLLPVADKGRQLSDDEAAKGVLDARYVGNNGRLYGRRMTAIAGDKDSQTQSIRDVETSTTIDIPPGADFLGVDAGGLMYVRVVEDRDTSPVDISGVSRKSDATTLVLITDTKTDDQRVLPLEMPHPFSHPAQFFSVQRKGLVALRVAEKTVDVLLYSTGAVK